MTEYFTKEGDEFKKVESELFTQDHLDKIVKDRAERVARQQFGDYDDLKDKAAKADTLKSDYETKLAEANGKVESLTKDLTAQKLTTDKVKIMHEFKLPDDMDEFVTGNTPDEMRSRAEKLAKGVKGGKIPVNKETKPGDEKTDSKKIARNLFGGKSDD